MNYKVTNYTADIKTPHIQFADVLETLTNLTIASNMALPKARDLARKLNGGQAFNGWTPSFFLETIPKSNLSEASPE